MLMTRCATRSPRSERPDEHLSESARRDPVAIDGKLRCCTFIELSADVRRRDDEAGKRSALARALRRLICLADFECYKRRTKENRANRANRAGRHRKACEARRPIVRQ